MHKARLFTHRRGAVLVAALAAALLAAALAPAAASAVSWPTYSKMRLSIWPEYDDPRVLVIMEPVLAESVKLPAKVSFLVPKGATVNMACEVTAEGGHNCRPKEVKSRGPYDEVTYAVQSRRALFFEYYYDADVAGPNRRFTFKYVPRATIGNLKVEIQRPLRAADFSTAPRPVSMASDQRGFTYYQYDLGRVAAGKPVAFNIGYAKGDDDPSVYGGVQNVPATSRSTIRSRGANPNSVLGLFGVAGLLGTIAYWVLSSGAGPERAGDGPTESPPAGEDEEATEVLCSSCGELLCATDRYCAGCGASQELVCAQCGALCDRGRRFCSVCGSELAIGSG